jgi:hypothetical protein
MSASSRLDVIAGHVRRSAAAVVAGAAAVRRAGVVPAPRVVVGRAEALACLRRDGAVVYQAFRDTERRLTEAELVARLACIPAELFGDDLVFAQPPISKNLGIEPNVGAGGRTRPGDLGMEPNSPHMDTAYGIASQDYLIITNDEPAEQGGESYLLDGYSLIDGLHPSLRAALTDVEMVHGGGFVRRGEIASQTSPCLVTHPNSGRLCLCTPTGGGIRNEDGSGGLSNYLAEPAPGQPPELMRAGTDLAPALHVLVLLAEPHAPRFTLQRGQYLIADNYRMFHGRERFIGTRVLRRCWFWSQQARAEGLGFAASLISGGASTAG